MNVKYEPWQEMRNSKYGGGAVDVESVKQCKSYHQIMKISFCGSQ